MASHSDTHESQCYDVLVDLLHPEGQLCPRCRSREDLGIHRRHRAPVIDYQCNRCGRVFNAWTNTPLQGTQRRPSEILAIVRGVLDGTPTSRLACNLGCSRMKLGDFIRRTKASAIYSRRAVDAVFPDHRGFVHRPMAESSPVMVLTEEC